MVTSFLFRQRPFRDETLESYLLRLTHANHESSYKDFSDIVAYNLELSDEIDERYIGGFNKLSSVNFYLEHQPRVKRITLLSYLAKMTNLDLGIIEKLGFQRTKNSTATNHKLIQFGEWQIPRSFFRKEGIPVCIACLHEKAYIRKWWHLVPYRVCHIHKQVLLAKCPRCLKFLDYRVLESFSLCSCGLHLNAVDTKCPSAINLFDDVDKNLTTDNLLAALSYEQKLLMLDWYHSRFKLSSSGDSETVASNSPLQVEQYFNQWPRQFIDELNEREEFAEYLCDDRMDKTPFSKVFGTAISCARLSNSLKDQEPILAVLKPFIQKLIEKNPPSKSSNIADLLLSIDEISKLMNMESSEVFRAYKKGRLRRQFRLKSDQQLEVYQPMFALRQLSNL